MMILSDRSLASVFSDVTHIYKSYYDIMTAEEMWQWAHGPMAAAMVVDGAPDGKISLISASFLPRFCLVSASFLPHFSFSAIVLPHFCFFSPAFRFILSSLIVFFLGR